MSKTREELSRQAEAEMQAAEPAKVNFASALYSASLFSATVAVGIMLYVSCVIFLMPTHYLEESQWDVMRALLSVKMMISFSLFLLPFVVLLQLVTGMNFVRRKIVMEFCAVLFSVLICTLFFWPGWFF